MSDARFQVIDVSDWKTSRDEPLGTKPKEWLIDPRRRSKDKRWLFKYRQRPDTGDDWAERIVAAIAEDLGIPHAHVELAIRDGVPGVLSLDLTDDKSRGELTLGNDLLADRDGSYPRGERARNTSKYSIEAVVEVLREDFIHPPPLAMPLPGVTSTIDVFIGYLMLDALVGNTDRNHQNWGVLQRKDPGSPRFSVFAPSFDHASSLARGLLDDARAKRLETNDGNHDVASYCRRAPTPFASAPSTDRRWTTFEAFAVMGEMRRTARDAWLDRLAKIPLTRFGHSVRRVPMDRMSALAKRFSTRMLECNARMLLESERA